MKTLATLVLFLVGCGAPLDGFKGTASCDFDGWRIEQEVPRDCAFYRQTIREGWELLVQRGFVDDADKAKFQTIPIHIFNLNFLSQGAAGEVVDGRYFQNDHIDTTWTAGAIAHEWLHHKDFLDGTLSFVSSWHWDWWTRGALAIDTEFQQSDSPAAEPFLATAWYGTTQAWLYSVTPKAIAAFPDAP